MNQMQDRSKIYKFDRSNVRVYKTEGSPAVRRRVRLGEIRGQSPNSEAQELGDSPNFEFLRSSLL
jgi:hypothetical protein